VKARRILVPLVAILIVVASAPTAWARGIDAGQNAGAGAVAPRSERAPDHEGAPTLRALPVLQRASVAAPGTGRRLGDRGSRPFTLSAVDVARRAQGEIARVDGEADARLLRASNTPCCVRGPPAAA
jgi:hypothetical protein